MWTSLVYICSGSGGGSGVIPSGYPVPYPVYVYQVDTLDIDWTLSSDVTQSLSTNLVYEQLSAEIISTTSTTNNTSSESNIDGC